MTSLDDKVARGGIITVQPLSIGDQVDPVLTNYCIFAILVLYFSFCSFLINDINCAIRLRVVSACYPSRLDCNRSILDQRTGAGVSPRGHSFGCISHAV